MFSRHVKRENERFLRKQTQVKDFFLRGDTISVLFLGRRIIHMVWEYATDALVQDELGCSPEHPLCVM